MISKSLAKASLFIAFALLVFSLLYPTVSHAESRMPLYIILIAVCENNSCKEGLGIQHVDTRRYICDSCTVVIEDISVENLSFISQKLNVGVLNGIYELKTSWQCLHRWEDEYCLKDTTIEKLSDNTTIAQLNVLKNVLKDEWKDTEQKARPSVTTQKWSVAAIIVAIVVLAIIWPWILVKIWPNLQKRISLFLIIAILLQVPLTLFLAGDPFGGAYSLWQFVASSSSIVLYLCILGEIIYLIVRKIRLRKVSG